MEALMRPLFLLCAPAIAITYSLHALRWLVHQVGLWWAIHGKQVIAFSIAVVILVIIGLVAVVVFRNWWEAQQVRNQQATARRQLDRTYQQTVQAINDVGTGSRQPSGKPTIQGQIVP